MNSWTTEAMGKGAPSPSEICWPVLRSSSVKLMSAPFCAAVAVA